MVDRWRGSPGGLNNFSLKRVRQESTNQERWKLTLKSSWNLGTVLFQVLSLQRQMNDFTLKVKSKKIKSMPITKHGAAS